MTPQEQELLTNLVDRLRQSPPQQRDPDADAMITGLVREKPDTPYVLAQTVLIQDYALHQAQDRIAQLERQLQGQPAQKSGGFLDAIFGNSRAPQSASQPAPAPQPAYAPAAGPWGQASAQPMYAQAGGQPSFLRSAATTAAGIAGGALLFQGIESLMGGHGGFGGMGGYGGVGGFMPQPGITETVVNNYYDSPGQATGGQNADFTPSDAGGGYTDASYDTGSDSDFGGSGDFGSDDV